MKTLLIELNYHIVSEKTLTRFIQDMDQHANEKLAGKIHNITSNNHLLESRDKWRKRAFTNMAYTNCYETAIETLYDKYKNNPEKIRLLDEINELYAKLEKTVEV